MSETSSTWREWVEGQTGSRVVRSRRLKGGITSDVRAVHLADGEVVVLRQWEPERSGVPLWVANEAAVLALATTDVPAPRLIAAAADEGRVLMSRMPGRVDLTPRDVGSWTRQLAAALPPIHAITAPARLPDFQENKSFDTLEPRGEVHRDAIALARTAATQGDGLLHTDFQHYNVLWQRGRLTAIVDWAWPSRGAPDLDLGHCMLNAVLVRDVDTAEQLREAYEAVVGRQADPACIACRLVAYGPGWKTFIPRQAIGVALDLDGMDARVDELIRRTLARAG